MATDVREFDAVPVAGRTVGQRVLLAVGSLGPLGYAPASGTVAVAVAGIPLCWLMHRYLGLGGYIAVTIAFTAASVVLHHYGDRILGESDSSKLVWDELAGFFLAMTAVPFIWPMVVMGFFLERIIDIMKVPPANWVDRRLHTGLGAVLDDVIAGLYTGVLLHLIMGIGPAWLIG